MVNYLEYIEQYIDLPSAIGLVIVFVILFMQLIGEFLEFKGKVVPEYMKFRKYFKRKRAEKEEQARTLKEVRNLLGEVNEHYSTDNISKRDRWMTWVNDRAAVYDDSIVTISDNLASVTEALRDNTRMTEEMFVQSSRDRIIDFATKVGDENVMVSREEFNRIFKVYDRYEKFLKERGLTNGEIDINYRIIKDSYESHTRNRSFIEDVRGYDIA